MPCYKPLKAWQNENGGPVAFSPSGYHNKPLQLPCSQCVGCRLERSRQWAVRCVHEASLWDDNIFVTLTYETEPLDGSLDKTHFQKFMKRLRSRNPGKPIRYYMCGEYGERLRRPHYHAIIFNHYFEDTTRSLMLGDNLATSQELDEIWGHGYTSIGEVNHDTCAYTSRYITKKITGNDQFHHYVNEDGVFRQPEYTQMSLKPAIGKTWYAEYKNDCYPSDFITTKGKKFRVPKYYDKLLEQEEPGKLADLKHKRKLKAWERNADNTPARLAAKEKCTYARLQNYERSYEG